MGLPWKRILTTARDLGKGFGGLLVPGLPMAIDLIEDVLPAAKGSDKLAAVEQISDAAFEAAGLLKVISPEQLVALRASRQKTINAYVASKNAEAAYRLAIEEYKDLVDSFQPVAQADGTGEP